MKRVLFSLFILFLLTTLITTTAFAGSVSPTILAGKTINVGTANVTGNPDGSFTIRLFIRQGYCLTDAAIHSGLSLADFPQNRGGAIPGQFDYKNDFGGCVSHPPTITIDDPAGGFGDKVYIAIHVNVYGPDGQQNTGWVVRCGNLEGGQFHGKNWSAYFIFPANAW